MSFGTMKATTSESQQYEVPPDGPQPAVLVAIVDLGTHREEFEDEKTKKKTTRDYRKVFLVWELPNSSMSGMKGVHHVIAKDYRLSFTKGSNNKVSALRGMIESWRGKAFAQDEEFDILKLLGQKCLLTIVHKESGQGKVYAKVEGVTRLPKEMACAAPQRKVASYAIEGGKAPALPDWIPWIYGERVVDVIGRCQEIKGRPAAAAPLDSGAQAVAAPVEDPDEIPF